MNELTPPPGPSEAHGRVLVLAPDEHLATAILTALHEAAPAAQVDLAQSLEQAQQIVVHQRPDLFVLDVDAIHDLGQEFLCDLRTSHSNARAIVLTAVHLASHRQQAAGLGAIHFLEKPFPHGDFVDLVGALLQPGGQEEGEKFQGTLSDLHIADIIQLKCMSGATSVLRFTGPRGEKARVYFEDGQVRHATGLGREGIAAFNEIVNWRGGMISEVSGVGQSPRTIDLDWQILLMEAAWKIDEARDITAEASASSNGSVAAPRKVLVIDDSVMLLNFVQVILQEAKYQVVASATAEEGLRAAFAEPPHLILLDYILPDMKGDEVLRRLLNDPATANAAVVYMSGFGADLSSDPKQNPNVVGSLNKPFTSELLLKTVETFMPKESAQSEPAPSSEPAPEETQPAEMEPTQSDPSMPETSFEPTQEAVPEMTGEPFTETAPVESAAVATMEAASGGGDHAWWSAAPAAVASAWEEPIAEQGVAASDSQFSHTVAAQEEIAMPAPVNAFFCGDTSFFSLNWALHTIADQKLTGTLRAYWNREPVELLARAGAVLLVTTRDPELYCPEAPITLVNIDEEKTARARAEQRESGRPLFVTLADEGLILREPAAQLVQHYGQKLFAQLWSAPRARFMFEQSQDLPAYANDVLAEEDVDHWALSTLRFIQFQDLGAKADYDPASVPAYTRNGFERVQRLRLTVAEAQFASQFNGIRSIAQIAKNLRLDLKFARLTLFRFLALEIVECWPPAAVGAKPEKRGVFGRMFGD